jgi:predicted kinase
MKPWLILVAGLPGVGKSAVSIPLSERLQAAHLNTDRLRSRAGKRGQYDAMSKQEVYEEMLDFAKKKLGEGRSVVLDATFSLPTYRDKARELARTQQAELLLVEITADPEVIRQRVSQKRPYSEADFAVFLKIREEFPPFEQVDLRLDTSHAEPEASVQQILDEIDRRQATHKTSRHEAS